MYTIAVFLEILCIQAFVNYTIAVFLEILCIHGVC